MTPLSLSLTFSSRALVATIFNYLLQSENVTFYDFRRRLPALLYVHASVSEIYSSNTFDRHIGLLTGIGCTACVIAYDDSRWPRIRHPGAKKLITVPYKGGCLTHVRTWNTYMPPLAVIYRAIFGINTTVSTIYSNVWPTVRLAERRERAMIFVIIVHAYPMTCKSVGGNGETYLINSSVAVLLFSIIWIPGYFQHAADTADSGSHSRILSPPHLDRNMPYIFKYVGFTPPFVRRLPSDFVYSRSALPRGLQTQIWFPQPRCLLDAALWPMEHHPAPEHCADCMSCYTTEGKPILLLPVSVNELFLLNAYYRVCFSAFCF